MRVPAIFLMCCLALVAGCPRADQNNAPADNAATREATVQKQAATPPPKPSIRWTGDATDFSFTTFAGETLRAGEFAGKPLVVHFWASW